MGYHVKVGASISEGVESLETFVKLRLGNVVLTKLPMEKEKALAVVRYCRRHRIYFVFSEVLRRGTLTLSDAPWRGKDIPRSQFYTKEELEGIFRKGGKYFIGRLTLGEVGGMLYWPKKYLLNRSVGEYPNLTPVQNVADAKNHYIAFMKKVITYERSLCDSKLLDADSSMVFKYHLEAGIDTPLFESMPGDTTFMTAAVRGAVLAYNRQQWGIHIAMENYGGMNLDAFWFKRWKVSLYYAFLTGADFIYPESGCFTYNQRGKKYEFDSPEMKQSRGILREFNQFAQIHSRPGKRPKVKLGFVHGNLDGAPGLWNKYVWGQFKGKKWLHGPAEWGWDYLDDVYRKPEWDNSPVGGDKDFYGNPPYGQYDIVPVEAPLSVLNKYACLVFLGWNTMTDEIYGKLKSYVSAGGHLVMAVPHLSTHTDRAGDLKLYKKGDYRDLFGVRIKGRGREDVLGVKYFADSSIPSYKFPCWRVSTDPRFIGEMSMADSEITSAKVLCGYSDYYVEKEEEVRQRPVLTENSVGKGKAFLIHSWSYPGAKGMRPFMLNLLRTIYAGEQGEVRIIGSDRIRYSVYEGLHTQAGRIRVIYLLNTEFDCRHFAGLWIKGKVVSELVIPPAEMRVVYLYKDLVLLPENRSVDLESWTIKRNMHRINLYSLSRQKITVCNLTGGREQKVQINGRCFQCPPGGNRSIVLDKRVDMAHKEFFDKGFLNDPAMIWNPGNLPY